MERTITSLSDFGVPQWHTLYRNPAESSGSAFTLGTRLSCLVTRALYAVTAGSRSDSTPTRTAHTSTKRHRSIVRRNQREAKCSDEQMIDAAINTVFLGGMVFLPNAKPLSIHGVHNATLMYSKSSIMYAVIQSTVFMSTRAAL